MISPRHHWAVQIAVTSMCWPHTGIDTPKRGPLTGCSNCTRLLAHEKKRYVMTPDQFRACVLVAKEWAYNSPPCLQGRKGKIIGIFGGEPLMSPYFADYVDILCEVVPDAEHRGLWTSYDWTQYESPKWGKASPLVNRLLGRSPSGFAGFLNWNMHGKDQVCEHQPVLKSSTYMIPDEKRRMELISQCWLNRDWSAAYALDHNDEPKFYFCEIAASFDRVMHLGIGLPLEKDIWDHDVEFQPDDRGILMPQGRYRDQVLAGCLRCGQPVPQRKGRRDLDFKDDISPDNLETLLQIESPMVQRGDYVLATPQEVEGYDENQERNGYRPMTYIKQGAIRSSVVQKR